LATPRAIRSKEVISRGAVPGFRRFKAHKQLPTLRVAPLADQAKHILNSNLEQQANFGRSTLALSSFFFYAVNILALVDQSPWHTKALGKK
jgi:hypothetical protein